IAAACVWSTTGVARLAQETVEEDVEAVGTVGAMATLLAEARLSAAMADVASTEEERTAHLEARDATLAELVELTGTYRAGLPADGEARATAEAVVAAARERLTLYATLVEAGVPAAQDGVYHR